ncbi:MAG TPA: HAD-IA family hydrolase [Bradyrhizobium sp.]|uniref:HAD-IA family hydrolase n=1 Tax=Bradyrhizobium sp. TaxID=376 RepID=UPI002CFCDEB6|nr:HAD-IA family hydrolase [Bradyrhizobium sp.]HLZ00911.1 HAD-IA family hydrolase [Bradyrhizobium sp.]
MPYSLAIFDLDGTLVDSFPWFCRTINDVADHFGFRRVTEDELEGIRAASTHEILAHLQLPLWKVPTVARYMRRLKAEQAANTPLFPGVPAMLRTLADAGIKLALVTSDSQANARRKLGESAALIAYYDCAASLFGKPARFRRVIRRSGVDKAEIIAIGDEVRDIEAARSVGIACGSVAWGYAAPQALRAMVPDFIFERMEDITRELLGAHCLIEPSAARISSGVNHG